MREGGGHELGQFAQTMAQSAEAEEAATAMHLVECWETRGKMEEDERETGKMISGVPPPLARSVGPSVCRKDGASEGMQCNVMEEQCNRWRSGQKFFLTVLRALIGGRGGSKDEKCGLTTVITSVLCADLQWAGIGSNRFG